MSLFKRKDSPYWWVKLSLNGRKVQKSTRTSDRSKAKEYHARLESQLWEQERLGVKPRHSWDEAVLRYLEESSHKVTLDDDKNHLRKIQQHFEGRDLTSINRTSIDDLMQSFIREGSSNTTVNRRMAVVSVILRKAMNEWEWLERIPRIRKLKEPKGRTRFLTPPQAQRLLKELPEHLRVMAAFSLATGLRQANVKGLLWSQVDVNRGFAWIEAHQAKAGKGIPVPLSAEALNVLSIQRGQHPEFVFAYRGKPIQQVGTKAWRAAVTRAGLVDFRWHDLRHTWASWHVQSGTPLYALQELGGWASAEMVKRYAHLSAEHLASYAKRFAQNVPLTAGYDLATLPQVH